MESTFDPILEEYTDSERLMLRGILMAIDNMALTSAEQIFITDAVRHRILYTSDKAGFGIDFSPAMGNYSDIPEYVVPEERELMAEIIAAMTQAPKIVDSAQRQSMRQTFDITVIDRGIRRIINQIHSHIAMTDTGEPWIILSRFYPSPSRHAGNLYCITDRQPIRYDFTTHQWNTIAPRPSLTPSEETMLLYSAQGYTLEEIASIMYRSVPTIKFYRRCVFEKLEANNLAEAFFRAMTWRII